MSVQVNETLLAMSFENEGKDEDDSDTLNDSDNIDSQHGSSNKGRKLPFNFDQIILNVHCRSSL